METNETLKLIEDKNFIDKIYQFSYHRCNTSYEAEDLCSDIILAVISAVENQEKIDNFNAFAWTVARRVYADFCDKRNKVKKTISIENSEVELISQENEINKFIEETDSAKHIQKICAEILFLSKSYREVMVMYYIDELKIKDIATKLKISENTVKQRLFSARNIVRKEVKSMNKRNLSLKPVRLAILGTGVPIGNDPRSKTERDFSQNLIYLCKNKPKTAKELSEELCVPMPYVEEELEIQCRGENGKYGMIRKLDNGKYINNIHLVDYDEFEEANKIYEKHIPEFCKAINDTLEKNKEKILSFPYLSQQNDLRFILWSFISRIVWDIEERINKIIAEKYFSDIKPIKREFTCVAIAFTDDQKPNFDFYGCDMIEAMSVEGHNVFMSNIYGKRIEKHFHCGHNLSQDEKLLMLVKSIGGLSIDELSEDEKEIAAKAIECGYIRKKGNIIEPKIIVINNNDLEKFLDFPFGFSENMESIIGKIAAELAEFMKKHIPKYLINEYPIYSQLIAGNRILSGMIEECIKEGLLTEPERRLGAEGVFMIVG